MKKRVLSFIIIIPLLIIFIVYGVADTIKILIDLKAEYIELEHNLFEEVELGNKFILYGAAYPLAATNRDIIWTSSDDSIAKIIDGVVHTYQEGKVTITASLKDNSVPSKSFELYVVSSDPNPKYISVSNPRHTEQGIESLSYYGMYRYQGDKKVKDVINLDVVVIPRTSALQDVIIENPNEEVVINENYQMEFKSPGLYTITFKAKADENIYATYTFKVVDGVNVYSYEDLLRCTNGSLNGEVVVMQTNLESKKNLSRANASLAGIIQNDKTIVPFIEIDSNYDLRYYHNLGIIPKKLKVGIEFKQDIYGNGFTINLHELTFPSQLHPETNKPILGLNDPFQGPLEFVSAQGVTVHGQDNIGFLVSRDHVMINNVSLKNTNNVSDLTHLDFVGTTLEIMGDNVTIINSIISNGRTTVRSFSNENLTIEKSILQYAREFILKIGSNQFIRAQNQEQLYPIPYDTRGGIASDSSVIVKDTFFYTSGIFCIGIDTHFSGPLLYDGTKYANGVKDLAATSYASHLTISGDVRFYDWKSVDSLDSSTLISGTHTAIKFDIGEYLRVVADEKMIKKHQGVEYVHGGIALFGGGLNLSQITFRNNDLKNDLGYYQISLADSRLDGLSKVFLMAAGEKPFQFYMYQNDYEIISIGDAPSINDLIS